MDRIRDLTGTDGRADELLTSTSGGLFDAQYLSGDPPASHLASYEQPQYVLRNKKSGVERTGSPDGETMTPDGDHQSLAIVTDCRVVFLVGRARGDHVESVDHDEIVESRAESSGFMTSALLIETVDGGRLRFPCRGDVSPVADYVDDAAQTWATASRLTDEASEQIEASRDSLEDGEFVAAREVLADVSEKVEQAYEYVSPLGDGATSALESRASQLIGRLHQLEQEIAAMKGAHHHAAAQEAWKTDHDFETAAREYERGADEYERALAADGDTPTDEALQQRLKGLIKERTVLRAAPMADARAAREVAMATDDPDEAAAEWETALTCYREAATLDWGEHDGDFFVERERARERAGEAATEALDAHLEAGREWVTAGDKIVRNGRRRAGRQAYQRAEDHFRAARETARELQPARLDEIEAQLAALEQRKSGESVPPIEHEEQTLAVDAVTDRLTDDETKRDTVTGQSAPAGEATDGSSETTSGTQDAPTDRLDDTAEYTPAIREVSATSTEETAVGETQHEQDDSGDPTPAVTERETVISRDDHAQASASGSTQGSGAGAGDALVDAGEEVSLADDDTTQPSVTSSDLLAELQELDGTALTELVAELWESSGWTTTVFSAETTAVYDILALRTRDGEDERLLLWTVHQPDGGAVDATVVRRCATTRDSSHGADAATLVTTGRLTNAARKCAEDNDVTVVDRETLLQELRSSGLADRLLE